MSQAQLKKTARLRCKAAENATRAAARQGSADSAGGGGNGDESETASAPGKPGPAVEVVLARLLTDTLAALTREFEKDALLSGEVSVNPYAKTK